jgi:hypothetical protein
MTDIQEPRLAPVSPPYDEDVARLLTKLMPPDAQVDPLVLFRVLAVHRDLADRLRPMASGLLNKGLLPARDREVFICRTTARAGAEYEWGVHASFFGSTVGLDEPTLQALATRPADDPIFDRRTRLLVTAADELIDRATALRRDLARADRDLRAPAAAGTDHPVWLVPHAIHRHHDGSSYLSNHGRPGSHRKPRPSNASLCWASNYPSRYRWSAAIGSPNGTATPSSWPGMCRRPRIAPA